MAGRARGRVPARQGRAARRRGRARAVRGPPWRRSRRRGALPARQDEGLLPGLPTGGPRAAPIGGARRPRGAAAAPPARPLLPHALHEAARRGGGRERRRAPPPRARLVREEQGRLGARAGGVAPHARRRARSARVGARADVRVGCSPRRFWCDATRARRRSNPWCGSGRSAQGSRRSARRRSFCSRTNGCACSGADLRDLAEKREEAKLSTQLAKMPRGCRRRSRRARRRRRSRSVLAGARRGGGEGGGGGGGAPAPASTAAAGVLRRGGAGGRGGRGGRRGGLLQQRGEGLLDSAGRGAAARRRRRRRRCSRW